MTTDINFAPEPTAMPITDLRVGDWVEVVPTQSGVRGIIVESGIATIDHGHGWVERVGRRRYTVASVRFTTLTGKTYDIPATFSVVARVRVAA